MVEKKEIRSLIKEKKLKLTSEAIKEKSSLISRKLMESVHYQKAECVYVYIHFNQEVETTEIIDNAFAQSKRVAAPKIEDGVMNFYYIHGPEDLRPGFYGIPEPETGELAQEDQALMIMPGVAFDEQKHRIGYGGGYYDRFLEAHPDFVKVAITFEFQIVPEIPFEKFDILPDQIITEQRIIN